VKITFDPAKRQETLVQRGIDFADAALVFEGATYDRRDERFDYPEPRYITAGLLRGRMVIIVWTPVEDGRRVISMRKANEREKARFGKQLA
jgi:uncharacterized protein